ncbi:hypothetical protein M430DRAFT_42558 [Amorphotheca resinae ATCC 22711]|uniref:Uncharacterized protein n=1 Tax=Amorphotheca resinae ATCC 22711 TaxID=857342 RepID=A0A2T3AZK8_AMORE|nr:hypothetical protein M430DRAFT_42558 [Amorphotheca resinae ATCC 22711]PSS16543.1 hypothetical protein M430DRAFT_42558 [Amorphotheca resinae ATCC 22711]
MMMWVSTLSSLLLLSPVYADILGDAAQYIRRDGSVEAKMRRYVDSIVEPMERRQSATSTTTGLNTTSNLNMTQWDAQTMAACTSALETLNGVADNPSGMAACYNLPYWDNSTGVFQADLRLFMISPPSGTFANISTQNVKVGLSYDGATVSAVNTSSLTRRRDEISLISWPRNEMDRRESPAPVMAQSYSFVGQISQSFLGSNISTIKKVLVPVVTLSAVDPQGQPVNTSLPSTDATFVNGVFSKQVAITKASVVPPMQTLVVASDAPFVVPGLHILIFPIGGIITGIWAVLFISTVAYGTIGRLQFKDHYRRRAARAAKAGLARI